MRRRRKLGLCCLAICALVIPAACTDGHASVLTPVFAPSGRTSAVVAGTCTYSITHAADQGLVTVDDNPVTVTTIWFPGMNVHPCRTHRSVGGTAVARRLATDIRHAPKVPSGTFSCPADVGVGVLLTFGYQHSRDELVYIDFTGCGGISATDRYGREMTDTARGDLRSIAPPGWLPYL